MEGSTKISIIIPVYNGEPYIKRCFDILNKQNFDEPWEIIIVDDASTDKSKEVIKKYRFPNLRLYSLPTNSGQSVARNLGITKALGEYIFFQDIDDLISVKSLKTLYKTAKDLGVFDAFFSFRSSFRSKLFKFFVSSNNKYQFNKNQYQNRHQVEKYNDFVNSCQNTNFPAGRITIHRNDLVINDGFKLTLGINPGASYGSSKRWYPEEFVKVATKLSSQYNIVIFGGTEEIDIANDIEQLLNKKGVDNYQNLAGRTTVSELIENISQLDLFITGDSGPMHVAAAFQVPTLAIFGPTKDEETGQWMNERSAIVKTDLNCQPCMKRTCPLKHHNCMKLIKSEDVIQAINNLNTKNLQ